MRRFLSILTVAVAVLVTGCSSNDFYRGRVEASGGASAQAYRVKDGNETAVTNRYTIDGKGTATVQTVKPYLTLDGAWSVDQVPGASVVEAPGSVVIRNAAAPVVGAAAPECPDGNCPCPNPVVGAAPRECGPVYKSPCSGEVGGTQVNNPSTRINAVEPGKGWPCPGSPEPQVVGAARKGCSAVVGVVAIPAGFAVHVGLCFGRFVGCVFGF